jgi:hypothetical protein
MKTTQPFRTITALILVLFTITVSSCKKESAVTPEVSFKPTKIITTENGATIRIQRYMYDAQGKLANYESIGNGTSDSVLIRAGSIAFKRPGNTEVSQVLTFNADQTFKAIFSASEQTDFVNNQTKLSRITKARPNNTPLSLGVFNYTNDNLNSMISEIRLDISYHNDLPYQKGINEIPVVFKPIQFYKIMEQENTTTMQLYSKLIKSIMLDFGNRQERHDYTYTFDAEDRVTEINELVTIITPASTNLLELISTVSY